MPTNIIPCAHKDYETWAAMRWYLAWPFYGCTVLAIGVAWVFIVVADLIYEGMSERTIGEVLFRR